MTEILSQFRSKIEPSVRHDESSRQNHVQSADGRMVAWFSAATNIVAQSVTNGRFVAFGSLASNLVPGDTFPAGNWEDIFVRDTCFGGPAGCTPSTVRVSVSNFLGSFATQSSAINDYPTISADGHYIVFLSAATNYLASGGNGHTMVYLAKTGF